MDVKEIQPPTIAIGDKQINLDAVFPPGQRRIALYGVDSVREALEKAIGRDQAHFVHPRHALEAIDALEEAGRLGDFEFQDADGSKHFRWVINPDPQKGDRPRLRTELMS